MEEQSEAINGEPEEIQAIVEKLKAWSDSLSPSEHVMLGLLLKRLVEGELSDPTTDDGDGASTVL